MQGTPLVVPDTCHPAMDDAGRTATSHGSGVERMVQQDRALHKLICGSPGSEPAGLVITKDPHLDPNRFKCQITCQTGEYRGSPVCPGSHFTSARLCCTTWCRTYLLCITLGTEHNCNVHQTPFFPHCTMCHMLDCKKYWGGSSRTMWTSMCREDITAAHSSLQMVSAGSHKAIVWLLLDKDANVNTQGGHFSSMLQAASAGGHEAIVWLLLDKDADINVQGGPFGSMLQAVLDSGHEAVIWLLLDKNSDVSMHALTRGMARSRGDSMVTRGWHGHKGTVRSRGDGSQCTHEGMAHEWMAWYGSEGRRANWNKGNYSHGHVR